MQFLCKIALPVVMLIVAGCASSSSISNATIREAHPRAIAVRVTSAGWPAKDVHRAGGLYALKCGRCHKFYDPAAYDDVHWQKWFAKMTNKAKLTGEEAETLSKYLAVARQ